MRVRHGLPLSVPEPEQSITIHVPPEPWASRTVRDGVTAFAERAGVSGADLTALLTAVGEAVANAIEHSRTLQPIEVRCVAHRDSIIATVRDFGVGFRHAGEGSEPSATLPSTECERGRGLGIMRRCTTIFSVGIAAGGGTSVVIGRRLRLGRRTSLPPEEAAPRPRAFRDNARQNVS